jgi:hypothetical protein
MASAAHWARRWSSIWRFAGIRRRITGLLSAIGSTTGELASSNSGLL